MSCRILTSINSAHPPCVVGYVRNVSGMVAGMFWYQYEYTGDEAWKVRVRA